MSAPGSGSTHRFDFQIQVLYLKEHNWIPARNLFSFGAGTSCTSIQVPKFKFCTLRRTIGFQQGKSCLEELTHRGSRLGTKLSLGFQQGTILFSGLAHRTHRFNFQIQVLYFKADNWIPARKKFFLGADTSWLSPAHQVEAHPSPTLHAELTLGPKLFRRKTPESNHTSPRFLVALAHCGVGREGARGSMESP
jgi:hypothetical protein